MAKAYAPDSKDDFAIMLTLVNTDKVWAEPAQFTARTFVAKGAPAYLYLFSYVSPPMQTRMKYGAAHASEIPYVFDNLVERNGMTVTPKDKEVSQLMNAYWVNFAKTGDPKGKGLPVLAFVRFKKERSLRVSSRRIGGQRARSTKSQARPLRQRNQTNEWIPRI